MLVLASFLLWGSCVVASRVSTSVLTVISGPIRLDTTWRNDQPYFVDKMSTAINNTSHRLRERGRGQRILPRLWHDRC